MEIKAIIDVPEKIIPAHKQEQIQRIDCDICKTEVPGTGAYDIKHVSMKFTEGSSYPSGGTLEKKIFDVCPKCFTGIVMPWMKTNFGAEPRVEEIDW